MEISTREPRLAVIRGAHIEARLDDRYQVIDKSPWAYLKDSHELELQGPTKISSPRFGVVRQHQVDEQGRLWLLSDSNLAFADSRGLHQIANSRGGEFRGLAVNQRGIYCGQGKKLCSWDLQGIPQQATALDFRVSKVYELDGHIGAEGDMFSRRLTIFQNDQPVAEGRDVVLGSLRAHPQGGAAWLERGQFVKFREGKIERHPVAPKADSWHPRPDGQHLITGGSQLLNYRADGRLLAKFDLGPNTYMRDLKIESHQAIVRSERYHDSKPNQQRVEVLDLQSRGDLSLFARWNRKQLAPNTPEPHKIQETYNIGAKPAQFPGGKVGPHSFFHQPASGDIQVRSPGIHHRFVLAQALCGPAGPVLAAMTDSGKLVLGTPIGLREFSLGTPPRAMEASETGLTVHLQDGSQAIVHF